MALKLVKVAKLAPERTIQTVQTVMRYCATRPHIVFGENVTNCMPENV